MVFLDSKDLEKKYLSSGIGVLMRFTVILSTWSPMKVSSNK